MSGSSVIPAGSWPRRISTPASCEPLPNLAIADKIYEGLCLRCPVRLRKRPYWAPVRNTGQRQTK